MKKPFLTFDAYKDPYWTHVERTDPGKENFKLAAQEDLMLIFGIIS